MSIRCFSCNADRSRYLVHDPAGELDLVGGGYTFATRALQGGARLEQISWALGHSSVLETQSRYAHWDTEQIWPAVMALSRLRGQSSPCEQSAKSLAGVLGVSVDWLFGYGDDSGPAVATPDQVPVGLDPRRSPEVGQGQPKGDKILLILIADAYEAIKQVVQALDPSATAFRQG